jgi:hypothetical protein
MVSISNFIKVRAKALRGRRTELVFIDKKNFERSLLNAEEKELFETI